MKLATLGFIALLATTGLSSCIKADIYNTQPTTTGYQSSFNDDFNYDAHNWTFNDGNARAQAYVSNGVLNYSYHPSGNGTNTLAITTGWDRNHDWDIQTRISSNNAMGLVFGVSASDYGYSVFIDDRGYFAVYDEGTATIAAASIINWQQSSAIRSGWNDLEVEQYKGNWTGYINGTQVFQIPAHTLYGNQIGYEVLANTDGKADYLTIRW